MTVTFKDKVVIITGGAKGIGKATAQAFETEGAHVEIIDIAPGDHFVGDIGQKETLEAFVADVLTKHKHVDVLVNNAIPPMLGLQEASFITGQTFTIDGGMSKQMIYHDEAGWLFKDSH